MAGSARRLLRRIASVFRSQRADHDLAREIDAHLTLLEDGFRERGMSDAEAQRAARLALGGADQTKERHRDARSFVWLDDLRRDVRYALRSLRRTPGFTAVAVSTLALGIGANTAMFSAIDSVLIKPLPFPDPDRLVSILETNPQGLNGPVSSGNFVDWRAQIPAFESVAAWTFQYFNVAGRDEPEQVQGGKVSASYLGLLGAQPAIGRLLVPADEQSGRERVAVLTEALWRRRFGSAPDLVGQTIAVDGQPFTVVGILPRTFPATRVLNRPLDLYVPLTPDVAPLDRRSHDLSVTARLKAGVTLDQAQAQLDEAYQNLAKAYPATNATLGARVFSRADAARRGGRPVLLLWMAAVGTVLLIACTNIANLLLARAAVRQKEMALRAALGADRGRLIRQLLTEGVVLALLGGIAGSLAAVWSVHTLSRVVPFDVVRSMDTSILDARVFTFSFVLSVVCGVAFGCAPVWQLTGRTPADTLENASRDTAIDNRRTRRAGRLFVVAQLALALVLSSGALLLVRSARLLEGMPRGLNLHNVLTMQIWLPRETYPDGRHTAQFFHDVLDRVQHVPGVESASVINFPPLAAQDTSVPLRIDGRVPTSPDEQVRARYAVIDPHFFRTMEIPVLSGRAFLESDADEAHGVVIVSASMAHRFWPAGNPIGQRIQPQFSGPQNFWDADFTNRPLTIVGVVGDVRDDGPALQGRDDLPLFYLPYQQNPATLMHLVIRTRANPLDAAPAVRRAVWTVDSHQPVFDTKSMEDVVAETFGQPHVMASLAAAFASVALLLAALGVYGLLSYVVHQRTRDIGIRMALGAKPRDVLQGILQEGAYLGLLGVMVGLAASFSVTRLLAGFLFGVSAADPLTFTGVATLLFAVTLAACLIPAYRAMRVDPLVALRCE